MSGSPGKYRGHNSKHRAPNKIRNVTFKYMVLALAIVTLLHWLHHASLQVTPSASQLSHAGDSPKTGSGKNDASAASTSSECNPIQTSAICANQGFNLGPLSTAMECAVAVANREECGNTFMFSSTYPSWGCRCCVVDDAPPYPTNPNWSLHSLSDCSVTREFLEKEIDRLGKEVDLLHKENYQLRGTSTRKTASEESVSKVFQALREVVETLRGEVSKLDSAEANLNSEAIVLVLQWIFKSMNEKLVKDDDIDADCGFEVDCPPYYKAQDIENSVQYMDEYAWALQPLLDQDLFNAHNEARNQCKEKGGGGVLQSGGWCLVSGNERLEINGREGIAVPHHHVLASKVIVNEMLHLIDTEDIQSVNDFGAGVGQYKAEVTNARPSVDWRSFDGAGNVVDYTEKFVSWIDLTMPLSLPRADWVFSLEVGEHIPNKFEGVFLRNLHQHNCKGIILSWAHLGQGGNSHINCHSNEYVVSRLRELGYNEDEELKKKFRWGGNSTVNQHYWFVNSVMVFRRNQPTDCKKVRLNDVIISATGIE